ncbi:unnamed protein product [Discosporangium mesarthrocarpum]
MSGQYTPGQEEAVIQRLQQELQAQAMQDMVTKMTEQCFQKCAKPNRGDRLDSSEQSCLAMCMDRYSDTMTLVNKAMVDRSNRR